MLLTLSFVDRAATEELNEFASTGDLDSSSSSSSSSSPVTSNASIGNGNGAERAEPHGTSSSPPSSSTLPDGVHDGGGAESSCPCSCGRDVTVMHEPTACSKCSRHVVESSCFVRGTLERGDPVCWRCGLKLVEAVLRNRSLVDDDDDENEEKICCCGCGEPSRQGASCVLCKGHVAGHILCFADGTATDDGKGLCHTCSGKVVCGEEPSNPVSSSAFHTTVKAIKQDTQLDVEFVRKTNGTTCCPICLFILDTGSRNQIPGYLKRKKRRMWALFVRAGFPKNCRVN